MPDTITPAADSGSHERVAFDLFARVVSELPAATGEDRIRAELALYIRCRSATYGNAR